MTQENGRQVLSHSGYLYRTQVESLQWGELKLNVTSLADIDQTIDDLFVVYQEQGRTELFEEMCPYFGILWPSGRVLAGELARVFDQSASERPDWARNPGRVLELGCGLGVVAMVLSKSGFQVDVIDQHPDAIRFLALNLRNNGIGLLGQQSETDVLPELSPAESSVRYFGKDWCDAWALKSNRWPLVVASDVLYDQKQPAKLKETLERTVEQDGVAIIADPGRSYLEPFVLSMEQSGWRSNIWGEAGVTICEFNRRGD